MSKNQELNELHKVSSLHKVNGKKTSHDEDIYFGGKGLTMKYFNSEEKNGKRVEEKLVVFSADNKKFTVKHLHDGKKDEKEMSRADLEKMLKSESKFAFMSDFLKKNQSGGLWRGKGSKGSKRKSKGSKGSKSNRSLKN